MTIKISRGVWGAGNRTLTDISAEEIFDLPLMDSTYAAKTAASAAGADTFGSWSELVADVGAGKRLLYVVILPQNINASARWEIEFGEGAGGSESTVARLWGVTYAVSNVGYIVPLHFTLFKSLSDNARLSARARDQSGSALAYQIAVMIA